MNTKHIMLDIETMSSQTNAAVLAVGMCLFSAEEGITDAVEFRCELSAMTKLGRHIDPNTVEWWLRQSEDARSALLTRPRATVVIHLCHDVKQWMLRSPNRRIGERDFLWAKGPSFDIAVMRSLFTDVGIEFPIHYRDDFCVRTMLQIAKQNEWTDILEMEPVTKHGALSDAIHQANQVVEVMRRINKQGHTPSESAAEPSHQETDQPATT